MSKSIALLFALLSVVTLGACAEPTLNVEETEGQMGSPMAMTRSPEDVSTPEAEDTEAAGDIDDDQADTGHVALQVEGVPAAPGGMVTMLISNTSDTEWGYNPCLRIVERSTDSGWVRIPEPARSCMMQLFLLEPMGSATEETDLPMDLEPGTYRLVLELTAEGAEADPEQIEAVSDGFDVQSDQ